MIIYRICEIITRCAHSLRYRIRSIFYKNIFSSCGRNIKIDENFIIVEVDMLTRFLDYVIDEDSKKIKRGVNDHRKEQHDILTFIKKIDAKPLEPSRHCPNCGASMDISKTGKCDYCNAIFNTLDYDYVLTKIN